MLAAWADCCSYRLEQVLGEQVLRILPGAHITLNNLTLHNKIKSKIHNLVRTVSLHTWYFQQDSDDSFTHPWFLCAIPQGPTSPWTTSCPLHVYKSLLKYDILCEVFIRHSVIIQCHPLVTTAIVLCQTIYQSSTDFPTIEPNDYYFFNYHKNIESQKTVKFPFPVMFSVPYVLLCC